MGCQVDLEFLTSSIEVITSIIGDHYVHLLHHSIMPDPVFLQGLHVFRTVILAENMQETANNTTSSPQKSLRSNKCKYCL